MQKPAKRLKAESSIAKGELGFVGFLFFPFCTKYIVEMYEELGFLFPYLQLQSLNPISTLLPLHKPKSNLVKTAVSEYNLGGEGDLFKAPEPIMEEPALGLDPMTLASMINNDEDIAAQSIKVSDISTIQPEHLLSETFTVPEYDAGGEGDLFKAPVSIMEEPLLGYDSTTAAISMISCGEDAISQQIIKAADMDSFQSDHLLSEVFYECKKDLMEKSAMDESFSKGLDGKMPPATKEEDLTIEREGLVTGSTMQKSVSSGSLSSAEWIKGGVARLSFLDFGTMDFEAVLGMRRAFSEGDIQTLCSGNAFGHLRNDLIEDRRLRLSRYRIKKAKRNFGRKVKYACRKALADSQPRVRGRFAKTEEACASNAAKLNKCKYSTETQVNCGPYETSSHAAEEITRIGNPSLGLDESVSAFCYFQELASPTTGSLSMPR